MHVPEETQGTTIDSTECDRIILSGRGIIKAKPSSKSRIHVILVH